MRSIIFWLIGMSLPALALGQEAARWYQIEVLFFRNLDGKAQLEEQWPQRRQVNRAGTRYELPGASTSTESQSFTPINATASGGARYTGVPTGERTLAGANSRLNNRSDYRVISYHAWRQALVPDDKPQLFYVASGNEYGATPELEGTIGLSLKHYLHVDTDLWWSEPNTSAGDLATLTPTAHLVENRRMRSGETNYLDHPLIGVLVRATPLDR